MKLRPFVAFALTLALPASAVAHPDWSGEMYMYGGQCESAADAARAEAQACRDDNASEEDGSICNGVTGPDGATYSPDQVDAVAARWDQDAVAIYAHAGLAADDQDALDAIEAQIAALGFSHRAADFEDWKQQSEDLRTTAALQVIEGLWVGIMSSESVQKALVKLTPSKLKKLARSIKRWAGDTSDALLEAIGDLTGARGKKKRAAAEKLVERLGEAKDLVVANLGASGWTAAAESVVILLGVVVAAMPAAAAAEAALIIAGAKALLTDIELAVFLYAAGWDIDGLTRLTEANLRALRDLQDRAKTLIDDATWRYDDALAMCVL